MPKLFIQSLPSPEELKSSLSRLQVSGDPWSMYANMLFMKVATELENHFDSFVSPHNLSSGRFTILYILNDSADGLMPSELSQLVGVTQATISGLINGLEKAEFLKRETHKNDGRSFVIKITEKGSQLIQQLTPLWMARVDEFWGQFQNEEERAMVSKILDKMVKSTAAFK